MKGFDKKNVAIAGLAALCILILTIFTAYLIAENNAKKAEIARLQQPRQIGVADIAEWVWGEITKEMTRQGRPSPGATP